METTIIIRIIWGYMRTPCGCTGVILGSWEIKWKLQFRVLCLRV